MSTDRERDDSGRPRNTRPRDELGRPLLRGAAGAARVPDDLVLAPADSLVEAQRLLDAGLSFHAHEVLEATWKAAPDAERELWQGLAQLAVGLTQTQTMRRVVLPQAVRRVLAPLLNDFISLQKDVALVSVLGPLEAFRVAQINAAENFNYTPLIAAALLYLAVTVPLARILDRMQARSRSVTSGSVPV